MQASTCGYRSHISHIDVNGSCPLCTSMANEGQRRFVLLRGAQEEVEVEMSLYEANDAINILESVGAAKSLVNALKVEMLRVMKERLG